MSMIELSIVHSFLSAHFTFPPLPPPPPSPLPPPPFPPPPPHFSVGSMMAV